jgi:hypothetical protein
MDDKVLIFVNFDFGQCWRSTVHSVAPPPELFALRITCQLVEFQTVNIHITLG